MSGDSQDKDRGGLIDRLMSPYHGDAPGASVLVIRGGAVVCRRAYGLADLEGHVAATPATNYRLASMTKQFTAAAVLLLEEDGRLSLDDRIRKWLPTLPGAVDACTIRHLLTHVSGLIDYEELIPAGQSRQLRDDDVLRVLESQDRTYFTPGARFRYSDTGYSLLALIVGRAAREDFASFLRRRIFLPLGMHGTVAYTPGVSVIPARAFGYTNLGARWARTDQSLTSGSSRSTTWPAGTRPSLTHACCAPSHFARPLRPRLRATIRMFDTAADGVSRGKPCGIPVRRSASAASSCAIRSVPLRWSSSQTAMRPSLIPPHLLSRSCTSQTRIVSAPRRWWWGRIRERTRWPEGDHGRSALGLHEDITY